MHRYEPSEIEPKWVDRWEAEELYRGVDDAADSRPRFFALDMFPYPSGDLHMGHAEAFSGGDTMADIQWLANCPYQPYRPNPCWVQLTGYRPAPA